ncbi:hypothetical protein [Streptomyces sp. CAU 1734]|uniref:hypothetical protein n=1 Tax=Streptomyces sp. CAU 1734 TaxID=3140360 RepID=UPI003260ED7C
MRKVATLAVTASVAAALLTSPTPSAHAVPHWNKRVKCEETDPDDRAIPTRTGNHELGWSHFSGKHNIKKCKIVNAALAGRVDKKNGARLEYWAHAINGGRQVKIVVIVQYARKTADGVYDAGRGQKIGVITAYCKGTNRCPDWVNE